MFLISEWIDMFREGNIFIGVIVSVLGLLVALLVGALILKAVDYFSGHDENMTVTVIEKVYSPPHSSSGTGVGVGGNGQVGMVVTFNHESEKYILLVKDKNGVTFSREVDAASYAKAAIGVDYVITIRVGGLSKERF